MTFVEDVMMENLAVTGYGVSTSAGMHHSQLRKGSVCPRAVLGILDHDTGDEETASTQADSPRCPLSIRVQIGFAYALGHLRSSTFLVAVRSRAVA